MHYYEKVLVYIAYGIMLNLQNSPSETGFSHLFQSVFT